MDRVQHGSEDDGRRFCERCSRITGHTSAGIELVEAPEQESADARLLLPYRVLKCERCWTETMRLLGN